MVILLSLFINFLPPSVIPQLGQCQGAVLLWQQCVGRGNLYHVTTESLLAALGMLCSFKLPEKMADVADSGTHFNRVLSVLVPLLGYT